MKEFIDIINEILFSEPVIFPSYVISTRPVFSKNNWQFGYFRYGKPGWDFISLKIYLVNLITLLSIYISEGLYNVESQALQTVVAVSCYRYVCLHYQNES